MATRFTKDKLNRIYCDKVYAPLADSMDISFTKCKDGFFISSSHKVKEGFKKPVFKVGCNKCDICYNESLHRKQVKWASRLGAKVDAVERSGGSTQWHIITMSPEDYVPLDVFKNRIKRMLVALRDQLKRRGDFDIKYVVTFEGTFGEHNRYGNDGTNTRLHANLIIFIDKHSVANYNYVEEYCYTYWQNHSARVSSEGGYKVERVLTSGISHYITKYITKESQTTRIMSSQFGWTEFMEEYRRKWQGLKENEKVRRWAVWDVSRLHDLRSYVNRMRNGQAELHYPSRDIQSLMAAPSKLFVVELDIPSDRFLRIDRGYKICSANVDYTETSITSSEVVVLPDNFDWSMTRRPSELAKHWQALVFEFQHKLSLSMQRPHQN